MEMIKDTVVNVDTATPSGILQAQSLNLADSGMVDVIISSYVLSSSALFTQAHRGRAFTLLRHPVDSAASIYMARKVHSKELRELDLPLEQYVNQTWYPDNFMVRQLTGVLPGVTLTEDHLIHAKNILSAKFFVGIVEQMEETIRQLKAYYEWKELPGKEGCPKEFVKGSKFRLMGRPKPTRGSEEWALVTGKERWDMELYFFGLEMFAKQSMLFPVTHEYFG